MDPVVLVIAVCACIAMVIGVLGCLRCRPRPTMEEIQRKEFQKFRKSHLLPSDRILTNRVDFVRPVKEYMETFSSPWCTKDQMMLWSPAPNKLSVSGCMSPKEHSFFDNSFQTVIEVPSVVEHTPDRGNQITTVADQLNSYLGCHGNSSVTTVTSSSQETNVSANLVRSFRITDVALTLEAPTDTPHDSDDEALSADSSGSGEFHLGMDELQPCFRVRSDSLVIDVRRNRRRTTSESQCKGKSPAHRDRKRRRTLPIVTTMCCPAEVARRDCYKDGAKDMSKAVNNAEDLTRCDVAMPEHFASIEHTDQNEFLDRSMHTDDRQSLDDTTNTVRQSRSRNFTSSSGETEVKEYWSQRNNNEDQQTGFPHLPNAANQIYSNSTNLYERLTPVRFREENVYQSLKSFTLPRLHTPAPNDVKYSSAKRSRHLSDIRGMFVSGSFVDSDEFIKIESSGLHVIGADQLKNVESGQHANNRTVNEERIPTTYETSLNSDSSASTQNDTDERNHQQDFNGNFEENHYESLTSETDYEDMSSENSSVLPLNKSRSASSDSSDSVDAEDTSKKYSFSGHHCHPPEGFSVTWCEDETDRYSKFSNCDNDAENASRRRSISGRCRHTSLNNSYFQKVSSTEERCCPFPSAKKLALKSVFQQTASPRFPIIQNTSISNSNNQRLNDLHSSLLNSSREMKDPKASLSFATDNSYLLSPRYPLKPLPVDEDIGIFSQTIDQFSSISPLSTYQTMKACTNLKTNGSLKRFPADAKKSINCVHQRTHNGSQDCKKNIFTTTSPFVMSLPDERDYFRF